MADAILVPNYIGNPGPGPAYLNVSRIWALVVNQFASPPAPESKLWAIEVGPIPEQNSGNAFPIAWFATAEEAQSALDDLARQIGSSTIKGQ